MLAKGGIKHCPKCNRDKELAAFAKSKRRGDGLTVHCKECRNRTQRERYAADADLRAQKADYRKERLADPEKHARQIERQRAWYRKQREDPAYCEAERLRSNAYDKTPRGRIVRREGQRKWTEANRAASNKWHRDYMRDRYTNDPEFRRNTADYFRRRRAVRNGNGGSFEVADWQALVDMTGGICPCCGEKRTMEADHIVPVSVGGSSYLHNIQPLCRSCNARKGTKTMDYRTPAMIQWLDIVTD